MKHIMDILFWVCVFFFGVSFGSFISAITYRMNPGSNDRSLKTILFRKSACDDCDKHLNFWELIPVFSYLFLRGKCTKCGHKIPVRYLVFELICGLIVLLFSYNLYIWGQSGWMIVYKLFIILTFLFLGYYDYLYWEIPLRFTFFCLIFILILQIFLFLIGSSDLEVLVMSFGGMLIGILGIAFLIYLSKGKGLGWGDSWIFGLVGVSLGLRGLFVVFFVAICVGAFVGIIKSIFTNTQIKGMLIQFVPFVSLGVLVFIYDVHNVIYRFLFPFF